MTENNTPRGEKVIHLCPGSSPTGPDHSLAHQQIMIASGCAGGCTDMHSISAGPFPQPGWCGSREEKASRARFRHLLLRFSTGSEQDPQKSSNIHAIY